MLGWVKHQRIEGLATSDGALMELLGFGEKKHFTSFSMKHQLKWHTLRNFSINFMGCILGCFFNKRMNGFQCMPDTCWLCFFTI